MRAEEEEQRRIAAEKEKGRREAEAAALAKQQAAAGGFAAASGVAFRNGMGGMGMDASMASAEQELAIREQLLQRERVMQLAAAGGGAGTDFAGEQELLLREFRIAFDIVLPS